MAIENGVQNAELGYILDPAFQIENLNGKPVVGGYICIYEAGTDNKYISYENFDGAQNPFKIPLKADGRAVILGDPSLTYDVYAYDSYGNQLFSRLNVQCNVPGTINLSGADTRIKNTDGTLDISLQTLGNNVRQYTINTHNKVLDVQSPLYFVENSPTATVIGFSGDNYATTADLAGKMDVSKLEYNEDGEISAYDGSAFAGQGGAGDPEVNELVHSNSATWNDVSAKLDTTAFSTVSGNFLTAIPDNYATKDYVQSSVSSKLDTTAFSTVSGNFLTAHQDLSDYLTKESADTLYQPTGDYATHDDLTAYQPAGDYYSASNPSGFITNDAITGLQPSGDYVTHDELTAYQPTGDYATHDDLTGYATTSLVSSVSSELYSAISGISGDYELVAGEGAELVDDPIAKTTTINVTAEGTPVTAIEQMIESATSGLQPSGDYATTAQVADKLDTTAFSDVSGTFLTAHQDLSDYATTAELANKLDTTAFSDVSGTFLTAHQDISNKLDTTAFSTVSGDFLTAVDLTPYQTTAGMTAYQPVGDYYSASNPSGFLTAVPAGTMNESNFGYDASNNITAYNGSAFNAGAGGLTVCAFSAISSDLGAFRNTIKDDPEQYAVSFTSGNNIRIAYFYTSGANARPDSVNPNITVYSDYYTYRIDDNTETSSLDISHSYKDYGGFTGQEVTIGVRSTDTVGGDVPEGVMVESGLEYNAVNEISGYNGSAIAQYGAEKQWFVHDDTLVHAANSAQYALGVNVSAVQTLMNVSEVSACMKIVNNTVTGNAGSINRIVSNVSADIPDGWKFMCWCSFHTNGWVGAVDAGSPMVSATDIWGIYAASNYSNTANCKINCVYLIKKKLPGEA